jgi:tRNA-splicing ligase RtcB
MPDGHQGYFLPIGGVLATDNAVIPYAVGVDIGCRMKMTILDIPGSQIQGMKDVLVKTLIENTVFGKGQENSIKIDHAILEDEAFDIKRLKKVGLREKAYKSLGSSGSGNHFCEFGIVEMGEGMESKIAILSHSGSRGVGYEVANIYTKIAKELRNLPGIVSEGAWLSLDQEEGQEYWKAMEMCGGYAKACHDIIHERLRKALGAKKVTDFENHHNFAWKEKLNGRDVIVHRKGATPAGAGQFGIIPGSMTTPTYIVMGLGNEKAINSSSHGAGRAMTRTAANKNYTMKDLSDDLELKGVTLIGGSVDECSMAYKSIDDVMNAQKDLVRICNKFTPVVVRMAGE